MSEFDDFAAKMQGGHAERQKAFEEQQRKDAEERAALWSAGKDYLENEVLPILSEAKSAFERQGLRVEMKKNWDAGTSFMRPEITFQVFGQKKRPFDTSTYEVSGNTGQAWHDGHTLNVGIADNNYTKLPGKAFHGSDIDAVREMARRALETLYASLDPGN